MKNHNRINFLKYTLPLILILLSVQQILAQLYLHTQGKEIVDEHGKKILLRGVGLGNWMLPEGYMWKFGKEGDRPRKIEKVVSDLIGPVKADKFWKSFRSNYIAEADIRRISELGYNSVRPALNARLFLTEGDKNVFIEEGFALLDNLVSWCKKYNLYVIIDMHAAPGGQTGQNIDDSPNNEPELFMNPKNQDLLEKLWIKIAERYKDEPTVAAYDLLNEPLPEMTGAAVKYKDQLIPVYERLIKAIRRVDQKHMITLEGYNWANDWSTFGKHLDDNLIYQFHYYCWNKPDQLNDISQFLEKQQQLNTPVWVGETGEKDNTIYFATTQYFEKNNIGWSFWPWKKLDTKNTPYSINLPAQWNEITAFTENGVKPASTVNSEKIFNEFLENIKLANCVYFPDVVNAMLRQLPVRIEGENYGHDGFGKSYFVKDTLKRSMTYRIKEPVPINVFGKDKSGLCAELVAGEWIISTFNCRTKPLNQVVLRAKALAKPAHITLSVNGISSDLKIGSTDWSELKAVCFKFIPGENQIKVFIRHGTIELDWIDVK